MTRRTVTVEISEKLALVVGYAIVKAEPEVNVHAGVEDEGIEEIILDWPDKRKPRDGGPPYRHQARFPCPSAPMHQMARFMERLFEAHKEEIAAAIERNVTDMDPAEIDA